MRPYQVLTLVLFCGFWLAPEADAGWREVDVSHSYRLHTVRAIDGMVYVGGAKVGARTNPQTPMASVILRFDGRGLAQVYEGPLHGRFWVIKGSRNALYAVADGAILRFDGSAWRNITAPAVEGLKFRFVVERKGDAYFLDEKGTIFKFDGATWTREDVQPRGTVRAVWADENGVAYLLVTPMASSFGGRTSTAAGLAAYRLASAGLEEIPFRIVGNRAWVENEHGGIFLSRVEPDAAVDEAEIPDVKGRIVNAQRTPGGLLVTVANEQTLRDAAPYPTLDWVLVSGDGIHWRKLTEVYAADGRPGPDHVIQVLPDGQIFVIALDRFYHYDGRGDIFDRPRKTGPQPAPPRPGATPRRR